jgi:hypothetical protein
MTATPIWGAEVVAVEVALFNSEGLPNAGTGGVEGTVEGEEGEEGDEGSDTASEEVDDERDKGGEGE